jgi:beta-glucosidase
MSKSQFIANADLDDLVNKLPLNEVINLTAGVGFWWTHAVPSANIPSIKVSLRKQA